MPRKIFPNIYDAQYISESSGNREMPAKAYFLKDKLVIQLEDEHGAEVQVFWFWENIIIEKNLIGNVELHYQGYPKQILKCTSLGFSEEFAKTWQQVNEKNWFKRTFPNTMAQFYIICLALITFLVCAYFWLIPIIANQVAKRIPRAWEVSIGEQSYESISRNFVVDSSKTRLVNEFFAALHIDSKYPVKITVVKDSIMNAFAVPGGHIVVYTALINSMQHPEELAALLSHEYSHVALQHTTRTLFRSMGTYLLVSSLFGNWDGVAAVFVENANNLKTLEYSRKLEKEADMNGLKLLTERNIDPVGFSELFKTLKAGSKSQGELVEWMSSHPDTNRRIEYIQKEISDHSPKVLPQPALEVIWEQLKQEQ